MIILYILIPVIILGIIFFINLKLDQKEVGKKTTIKEEIYYEQRSAFFSKSEYMFFQELEKQNNEKYHIFPKVRLEDIVQVKKNFEWKIKNNKRKSIRSRHVDFVLIDKKTGKVFKAIEVDGTSHNSEKQKKSDEKKNMICEQAGIDLVRIRVGENFEKSIKEKIYV